MLVPRVCAPRVTRFSLGRYWSHDLCSKQAAERLTGWLGIQTVILSRSDRLPRRWGQQAANPGVHRLSMTHSERQRNLMMHAQCPCTPCLLLSGCMYAGIDLNIFRQEQIWLLGF